jgi:hypothetical protein
MAVRTTGLSVLVLALPLVLGACTNPYDPNQRAAGGMLAGAAAGAAIGAAAGGGHGAALGAAIGAAAGLVGGVATTPPPPPYPPPQATYYPPPPGYGMPLAADGRLAPGTVVPAPPGS